MIDSSYSINVHIDIIMRIWADYHAFKHIDNF